MTRKALALRHFKRADPYFYRKTKPLHHLLPAQLSEKRTRSALFAALVSIVISQQLGTAAADTIFSRVRTVCGGRLTSLSLLRIRPETLHRVGLSGAKTKTLKAIAKAVEDGSLDLLVLKRLSEAEATSRLVSLWGLGPWSAEMFMMSALGRGDIFSSGDLGLIRAMERLYGLPKGSSRDTFLAISEKWAPHRTYASLLLWAVRDRAL